MRTRLAIVVVLTSTAAAAGCSKKKPSDSAPEPGSGATASGSGPGASGSAIAPPPPAGKPAPKMTGEMFIAEPPAFTIEALDRGLWIVDNGAAPSQACRVELGMAMARTGKVREMAKAAGASSVACVGKDAYTVCSFAGTTPETMATWVFGADDNSDDAILLAVSTGMPGAWDDLAPHLAKPTPCPRPSDDP